MFEITLEDINEVEGILLKKDQKFTNEQCNIIKYEYSGNIVACPGSGKTTVLIAKIAILMKKLKQQNAENGICIITHTNVAVEEILSRLKTLGVEQVSYPHFIGTIHEFLNKFFAMKAYTDISSKERYYILEEDEYKTKFSKIFEQYKPSYWTRFAPTSTVKSTRLIINHDKQISLLGIEDKSYRNNVLNTFKNMFNFGLLRHNDTISLAEYYVEHHINKIREAFKSRFSYFFIDEAQDTSVAQYSILLKLLENNERIITQFYGDPYQALYNLYSEDKDAWMPPIEERKEIATSNRFGESIAKVLRTTCIERYNHLVGNDAIASLKPHLILYDDSTKVLETYCNILNEYKSTIDKNKIFAISQHHDAISTYYKNYQKIKIDPAIKSVSMMCMDKFHQVISKTVQKNNIDTHNLADLSYTKIGGLLEKKCAIQYYKIRSSISKLLKKILMGNTYLNELQEFEIAYIQIISESLKLDLQQSDMTMDIKAIENFMLNIVKSGDSNAIEHNVSQKDEFSIQLRTIHAVKGETHSATLLLESKVMRDDGSSDLAQIFPFLVGNYDSRKVQDPCIRDTLKLAYVALSRPQIFMGIALQKNSLDEHQINSAIKHGWEIIF